MKKIAIILVVLFTLVLLCSCADKNYYDYETMKDKTHKIQIIEYDEHTEEEQLLITISEADRDCFLLELSNLHFHSVWGDPPGGPGGQCIKLVYSNNDFEIISWAGSTKHRVIMCDKIQFESMLQKYLTN